MVTKKATKRERELRLSRGGAKKNRLVMIISAVKEWIFARVYSRGLCQGWETR